ncbi:hypothetical protein PoB_003886900 [Plakobranchus ocellatus]|uniref:Uncharacterized protein n=1 Tax=Plakobranchus ocellatus TaxID=259542 RepID=A0AAV4AX42_9GAST|nr:hypothetical protein PoB_003886900 [Plakobranchus ocellatus]
MTTVSKSNPCQYGNLQSKGLYHEVPGQQFAQPSPIPGVVSDNMCLAFTPIRRATDPDRLDSRIMQQIQHDALTHQKLLQSTTINASLHKSLL